MDNSTAISFCVEEVGENIILFNRIRRLKDIPSIVSKIAEERFDRPYVVFDFRTCGNPNAIGLKFEGNYHRIGDGILVVFNKAFKVLRPAQSSYTLFVGRQEFGNNGTSLFSSSNEIEITAEVVNIKASGFYEEPLAHLDSIAGYLIDGNGKVEIVWEPMISVKLNSNLSEGTGRVAMTKAEVGTVAKQFFSAMPRKPFFQTIIDKGQERPVLKQQKIAEPEPVAAAPIIPEELTPVAEVAVESTPAPVSVPESTPVVVSTAEAAPVAAAILEEPKPVEVVEKPSIPAPAPKAPAAPVSFVPIAPRNAVNFKTITWGGLVMTKYLTTNVNEADITKNINSDIFYFAEGTASSVFGKLVFGGNYTFVKGDSSTHFPGFILFKKTILTQLPTGNMAIKAKASDQSPCNIPTLFVGSKLLR